MRAPEFTLGVEEEFHVLSPVTGQIVNDGEQVLDGLPSNDDHFTGELIQSMIETCTPVCTNLDDVRNELYDARRQVIHAARSAGRRVAAAGTLPLDDIEPLMTDSPRYHRIGALHQQIAFEQRVCGCHVHVGVSDRDTAVAIAGRVRGWLPVLLAMTVNSPFWAGEDTGYASYRTMVWSRWPTATPFPDLNGAGQYDALIQTLLNTEVAEDMGQIYWDMRLANLHPTLEFRTADVCLTVEEAVVHAALCRALVRTAWADIEAGRPDTSPRQELLRAMRWKAARYGLSEKLITPDGTQALPASEIVDSLLAYTSDALDADNCRDEVVSAVKELFATGTPAERQRTTFEQTRDLRSVVDMLVRTTEERVTI